MKETKAVDPTALVREAEASEHGESYKTLARGRGFLLSAGARVGAQGVCFIEVSMDLCVGSEVDLARLEVALGALKALRSRGYRISCHEGNASCELEIAQTDFKGELSHLMFVTRDLIERDPRGDKL
jgi:hypothetical protein